MADIIDFFQEFGGIIAVIFIIALFGIIYRIFDQALLERDAQIQSLKEKIADAGQFSVEKSAHTFYSTNDPSEHSIEVHEIQKPVLLTDEESRLIAQIEQEIGKPGGLKKRYPEIITKSGELRENTDTIDICGKYKIVGKNPGSASFDYFGTLEINKTGETYSLFWKLQKPERQFRGAGLLKDNVVSVAFEGIVMGIGVYEINNRGIIRGTWTGYNEKSIGIEEGTRMV